MVSLFFVDRFVANVTVVDSAIFMREDSSRNGLAATEASDHDHGHGRSRDRVHYLRRTGHRGSMIRMDLQS